MRTLTILALLTALCACDTPRADRPATIEPAVLLALADSLATDAGHPRCAVPDSLRPLPQRFLVLPCGFQDSSGVLSIIARDGYISQVHRQWSLPDSAEAAAMWAHVDRQLQAWGAFREREWQGAQSRERGRYAEWHMGIRPLVLTMGRLPDHMLADVVRPWVVVLQAN